MKSLLLLKTASASGAAGHALGKGIKALGKAARTGGEMSMNLGGGLAKELGAPEGLGKVVGGAGYLAGGAYGAKKGKEKIDRALLERRMRKQYERGY